MCTGFANEYVAELVEGLEGYLLQTLMDLVEDIGKFKVIYGRIELKSDKISRLECIHTLEWFPFVDIISKNYFEVGLDGLQKVWDIDISKLVLPHIDPVCIFR